MTQSPTAFDPDTLRRLHEELGAETSVTLDIVRTFLRSADDLLAEARAALETKDNRVVRRVAHTLKSSAATVGAATLAAVAREIELSLAAGRAPVEADVSRMAAELAAARALLESWRP